MDSIVTCLCYLTSVSYIANNMQLSCIKQMCCVPAAKNLALAGVKSVTLHDVKNVEMWDLSANFFLSENDIGKNRAAACVSKLQELNNAVLISALTEELTTDHLSKFLVCCTCSILPYDEWSHIFHASLICLSNP